MHLIVIVILLTSALTAQARPALALHSALGLPTRAVNGTSTEVFVDHDGWTTITVTDAGGQVSEAQFTVDVPTVGAYEVIGTTSVDHLIVAGRGATGGRLEHWSRSGGQWSKASDLTLPGTDFSGIAYDGAVLYLLDCVNNAILVGAWSASQPLNQLASGLAVLATEAQLPSLSKARWRYLLYLRPGLPSNPTGPGVLYVDPLRSGVSIWGTLIHTVSGSIAYDECYYTPWPGPVNAVADETTAFDGCTTLTVVTAGPHAIEVRNPSNSLIGSGVGPASGGPIVIALSEALQVGGRYQVHTNGVTGTAGFTCLRRHGFPEVMSNGAALQRIYLSPTRYHVNNPTFAIEAGVKRGTALGPRIQLDGVFAVGFDNTPIVPYGNGQGTNQLLVTEYWTGATGFVAENQQHGFVQMQLPIPNNPSLEGVVLLGQFLVADGSSFRLSEVIGYKIVAAPIP